MQGPSHPLGLHTGALLRPPPGGRVESHVTAALAFQVGATVRRGWGETTLGRGALLVGGEWAVPVLDGLALGGQLALLELLWDHVVVEPAIDEQDQRLDLGSTWVHLRYQLGSDDPRGRWLPATGWLRSHLTFYVRATLPTATSVLSRERHPRIPIRDALGDGVNDMRWGGLELGASFGVVLWGHLSAWLAWTPLAVGLTPLDTRSAAHWLQVLHLDLAGRLPWRLPGGASLEILLAVDGRFRLPADADPGLAFGGIHPGLRWRTPGWDAEVGARVGFGDWAALGDRYTVGAGFTYRFQ